MSALSVRFDEEGLIPAVIQDADSGEVLMMAYMNAEALDRTRQTGTTHFWSRSRGALWQKGETSGHVQHVKSMAVNCYENCLLVRVEQIGAACHTGYPTCFFREIDGSGNYVTVQERSFDPASVYFVPSDRRALLERWIGAYRWLADHDLESKSQTSRALRTSDLGTLSSRVGDELMELADVLRGEHRHISHEADIVLEGSQALYWAVLTAIRAGLSNHEIMTSFAPEGDVHDADVASSLVSESPHWSGLAHQDIGGRLRTLCALVSAAAATTHLDLTNFLEHDLAELQSRPYLNAYFANLSADDAADS